MGEHLRAVKLWHPSAAQRRHRPQTASCDRRVSADEVLGSTQPRACRTRSCCARGRHACSGRPAERGAAEANVSSIED
jgi:hypothetical protein